MPTLVSRLRHLTATQEEPLHEVSQTVEFVKMGPGQGQVLGGKARSRKSTPPDADKESSTNPDKTPSARAKVLPWVQGIDMEGYQPPEGMFGPYDSQPPTRVPSMMETQQPPTSHRQPHPFAYTPGSTIPFAAAFGGAQDHRRESGGTSYEQRQGRRPESDVLSRGAGLRSLHHQQTAIPGGHVERKDSPSASRDSIGVGTFGRDAPTPVPKSPSKVPSNTGNARSPVSRKPVPSERERLEQNHQDPNVHVHHPHHDYPFSHAEAAKKQSEAMETARAQALAQLEAEHSHQPTINNGNLSGMKGPRGTYQTSTSGPSFGHILHHDGQPIPVPNRLSQQTGMASQGAITSPQDISGVGMEGDGFFRIPFGVPMGAILPRQMMLMRTNTGMDMGIGIGGFGGGMGSFGNEVPHEGLKGDRARSAYMETVEDEEEPTARSARGTAKSAGISPKTRTNMTHDVDVASPAQTMKQSGYAGSKHPGQSVHGNHSQHHVRTLSGQSIPSPRSQKSRIRDVSGLSAQTARTVNDQPRSTKAHSVISDSRTQGTVRPHLEEPIRSAAPSIAPTTASNVKKIVSDSKFHDETLCQLLDAARLNLIGDEAKKALNRAARARVIELKDLRVQGQIPEMPPLEPAIGGREKKEKSSKSKDRERRHRSRSISDSKARSEKADGVEPTTPPQWAQEILTRLNAFDARFGELEKHQQREFAPLDDIYATSPDLQAADMLEDLLINQLQGVQFPGGMHQHAPFPFDAFGLPRLPSIFDQHQTPPQGARIETMSPTVVPNGQTPTMTMGGDDLTWGSEVELPNAGETVPPPRQGPPIINIQAPTESNVAKTATRVPSASTHSRSRTPRQVDIDILEETVIPDSAHTATQERRNQSLPTTPAESITSNRPSPVPVHYDLPPISEKAKVSTYQRTQPPSTVRQTVISNTYGGGHHQHQREQTGTSVQSPRTAAAVTALTHIDQASSPIHQRSSDKPSGNSEPHATAPWDLVTQKLYAWAMVWEEESFVRGLEGVSLGKQVEEVPLTIFSMMIYKRLLRRNLSTIAKKPCEKLFVPPTMTDAINKAVHSKNFGNAKQILEEMWYPFGFKEPPRVIIALGKHRNEADHWTAHRFDLASGHLTSYSVTHEDENLPDGRPFMWWHAIREAWPEYNIPHPDHLRQRVEIIHTPVEEKGDNSLKALNYARNLLLGFRPELARDMTQLRETVWQEVKRLLQKKRTGKLVVTMDSPEHSHDS